ncbi:glycosyltransferase family 2 protein, partial [Cephaloticoccus capnophilus]|uniref:glycosyltransferase family 2 protein n=1 Tax=Cephaloticoccus capnophilus TaxID=1548208 RepID=UPI0012E8403D
MSVPNLALVIPVYNESEVLPELLRRLTVLFDGQVNHERWTAILVDDGSRDDSVAQIEAKCASDRRFRLIELSRNFGFQAALLAGLEQAKASGFDAVVTLDADLQDPPELIPQLVQSWQQEGSNVVLARRRSRRDRGVRALCFKLFHAVFGRVVDIKVDQNTGTFGLLDRKALSAFSRLPESHRFFPGLRAWLGFKRSEVFYDRQERAAGVPTQSFIKLLRYGFDAVFSFSRLPLRLVLVAGAVMAGASFIIGAAFALRRLLGFEIAPTGFTTLATVILLLGGIQLMGLGIIGEYLGRTYT